MADPLLFSYYFFPLSLVLFDFPYYRYFCVSFNYTAMRKFYCTFIAALPVSWIAEFLQMYVVGDCHWVLYLAVLMTLDTLLGFTKHWMTHTVSSKGWGDVGIKLLLYSAVLILGHVLGNVEVAAGTGTAHLTWFKTFACIFLILREALSIVENIEEIKPGFFPKWLVKRLYVIQGKDISNEQ